MKKYHSKGFTLVELLLVIAIIAILATVLFVSLGGQRERARVTSFKENARGLVTTFTACTDGGGAIPATGTSLNGTGAACTGGTSGVTGILPKVSQCNSASAYVALSAVTTTGDNWTFTAVCNRSTGSPASCTAECNADGCTYTGTCE